MRAARLLAAVTLASLIATSPVAAATKLVVIQDFSFQPAVVVLASPGDTVQWRNDGAFPHTSTGVGPLAYWDSQTISPGQTYPTVFPAAGRYDYVCSFHPDMRGVVRVPVRATPTVGTTATTFVITWASMNAPTNQRYQVQRLAPGATTWAAWRTTTARQSTFVTSRVGTWNFRASLQRWTGSRWVSSGWSSARRVTVNA